MSQSVTVVTSPGIGWEIDIGDCQGIEPTPPTGPKKVVRGKKRRALKPDKPSTCQKNEVKQETDGEGKTLSGSGLPDISTDSRPSEDTNEHDEDESVFGDDMAIDYVPPKNNATVDLIAQRKFLDLKKWYCISRPQYSKSCGISSLVSCWNYLFSRLGAGSLRPITQEEALTALNFKPPFGQIKFGPFTGNQKLLRWFKQLNDHYGVRGHCSFLYKPVGGNKTIGVKGWQALKKVKECLRKDDTAIIYHCLNHYFCPIGYEDVPRKAWDAYNCRTVAKEDLTTWILIGDSSKKHPGMHCIKWDDIEQDLNLETPEFLDVRRLHKGVQKRNTSKKGGNMHCLMVFQRSTWQGKHRSGLQKHQSLDRGRLKKTSIKPTVRVREVKSDSDSNMRLPPIGGDSNAQSDVVDEMMHWVQTGAISHYDAKEAFSKMPDLPQEENREISMDGLPKIVGYRDIGSQLESNSLPQIEDLQKTCLKSVRSLSLDSAMDSGLTAFDRRVNTLDDDVNGAPFSASGDKMEVESDCMSGDGLDEIELEHNGSDGTSMPDRSYLMRF